MRRPDFEKFLSDNAKIKLTLRNRFNYTGEIEELREDTLVLLDKFGNPVVISLEEVSSVEVAE